MLRRYRFPIAALAAFLLVMTAVPPLVQAQSLDDLRASGAVGERFDGFAQALKSSAAGVVKKVNAKRQKIYSDRAAKEGTSVEQVGRVYAKQIFRKAPPGTKLLQENGKWVTK
ncbi:MAG: YdbL family protein [Kiloniellales bacterium]